MPKVKKVVKATKQVKQKLSPAERSQIAKDRWAKIRKAKAAQDKPDIPSPEQVYGAIMEEVPQVINEMLVADAKTGRDENGVPPVVGLGDGTITSNGTFVPDQPHSGIFRKNPDGSFTEIDGVVDFGPVAPTVAPPAPQLAPVKAPKVKKTQVPKEFLVALKTADKRLAEAIDEYEDCKRRISYLEDAIPRLQRTTLALRSESNPDMPMPPAAYNFPGSVPNATNFQVPMPPQFQAPLDPMDAIRAAMAQPPVSRAVGNAVQLPPDVVGTLEGPDDDNDDPDKFLTGPYAGGGFIGG